MIMTFCRPRRIILAAYLILSCCGCASTPGRLSPEVPAMHTASEFADDERIAGIEDPWEGFNRRMYNFNYSFDRYLFLPVVRGYERITPAFVQTRVSSFFSNIGEIHTIYNSLLQLKGKKCLLTCARLVTNTTIGIGGLFDQATRFGLRKQNEDFGQTLGSWGVAAGPYLVLPVLGPNTLRSAGGLAVDRGTRQAIVNAVDPLKDAEHESAIMAGISGLEAVDLRHREGFRYYESGYPFEYYLVRFLSCQSREFLLLK